MKIILRRLLYSLPVLSWELSNKSLYKVIPLYLKLVWASVTWKLKLKKVFNFNFKYKKSFFSLTLNDSTDVAALEEIYVDNEYVWSLPKSPKTILDLGANYGDTAIYYHSCYPEAVIYAVEASPESYRRLVGHTKSIPKIIPIHAAIADFIGEVDLFLMSGSSLGNSLKKISDDMKSVLVSTCTLDSLSKKYNKGEIFDLVKFDIEGAEERMFKNVAPENYASAYTGEIHYDLMDLKETDLTSLFDKFDLKIQRLENKNRVIIRAILK